MEYKKLCGGGSGVESGDHVMWISLELMETWNPGQSVKRQENYMK